MIETLKTTRKLSEMTGAWHQICGQNTHERLFKSGALFWRTYLKSCFQYNGQSVENYYMTHNIRTANTHYSQVTFGPKSYYIDGQKVMRTQMNTDIYKYVSNILDGMDDIRVSCNMQGQIFKN